MYQTKPIISKIFLNSFKAVGTIFLGFIILIVIYSFLYTPSKKEARKLVISYFHYPLPTSANLIYSKNYWASFDNIEPRSICFGFQYTLQDFINFNNFNFSESNHNDAYHSLYPVANNKSCAKLVASQYQVKKHFRYSKRLQGGTIFIDRKNKIVMFEVYFFD